MRVLYFGTYERDYPRNAQVISCLRRAGVEVEEHHVGVWEGSRQNWHAGIGTIARLSLAELRLLRRPPGDFDALVVGYPGHFDLTAARRAARGRPVVFNPLVSLSDTFVADRGRFRDGSVPARALRAVDRHALRAADLVVADTRANADHLAELADLRPDRVEVAFVGAEERVFTPGWTAEEPFTALFVGKLIPLHGVETILAAARRPRGCGCGSSAVASSNHSSKGSRPTWSGSAGSSTSSCPRSCTEPAPRSESSGPPTRRCG